METFQDLAKDSIMDAKKETLVFKAIKLPTIAAKCHYLKDCGTRPIYNCFFMRISCDHGILDLPPMNNQIKQHNKYEKKEHRNIADSLLEFNVGI